MRFQTLRSVGFLLFTLSIITLAMPLMAQTDHPADHAELVALREKVATAVSNQDVKTLCSVFAKQFVFTAVDQTPITSEEQFTAFYDRLFHAPGAIVTSVKTEPKADILTRFIDTNTGVCYGSSKETYTMKDGSEVTMDLRWTATVIKEDGVWKVAAAHVGTNFMDNPVLTRLTSYSKKLACGSGIAGVVIGVLLGFGICCFLKRCKCKKEA